MTELEILVAEWRDARLAILLINWGDPVVAKASIGFWTRMGHAESALMAYARTMVERPEWPEPGCMREIDSGIPLKSGEGLTINWSPATPQPVEVIVHTVPRAQVFATCFNPDASLEEAQRAEAGLPTEKNDG